MPGSSKRTSRARSSLTWPAVVTRRMERQALLEPAERPVADVARAMCGVHAQVMSAAELSLGRRVADATRSDVRRALWEDRTLIKTLGPRGTVHLLPAAEFGMWTGALSTLPSSAPNHPDSVRFTRPQTSQVIDAIDDALADAELTVDELTEAIGERLGLWAVERTMDAFQDKWPRWRQLTGTAAHLGVLCFGPNRGRNITYTSPRRWLPGFRPNDGASAARALLHRYLHAYGPATSQHFAKWLNIPHTSAARLFDELSDELEPVELDGEAMWVRAGDAEAPADHHRGIRLLPYFDAFVVASRPRSLQYPGLAAQRALSPTGQAGNYPVMLVDGVVGGVWHTRRSGRKMTITVEPLGDLGADQHRLLADEVELLGAVMEGEPTLTIGRVSVGPHA